MTNPDSLVIVSLFPDCRCGPQTTRFGMGGDTITVSTDQPLVGRVIGIVQFGQQAVNKKRGTTPDWLHMRVEHGPPDEEIVPYEIFIPMSSVQSLVVIPDELTAEKENGQAN